MSKSDWQIIFALPNLSLGTPFEAPHIAIAPLSDERVQGAMRTSQSAKKFLNGFIDDYDDKVEPAVLIIEEGPYDLLHHVESLVGFRNIVALSVNLHSWSRINTKGTITSPMYSDSFDFYPITLAKEEGLISRTPAQWAIFSGDAPFIGMASRAVPRFGHTPLDDHIIMRALIEAWQKRYIDLREETNFYRSLFRSLQIAYVALALPTKNESSIYDYGINISLWVSSLEILAHPQTVEVNLSSVLDLLEKYRWRKPALEEKKYTINSSRKGNLIQFLYKNLYDARNFFLHGDKIKENILAPTGNNNYRIWRIAPTIYRTALYVFLLRSNYISEPKEGNLENYLDNFGFYIINSNYEKLLLSLLENSENSDNENS